MASLWGAGAHWENDDRAQPHEANHLTLDSSKASLRLGWRPELRLKEALALTVAWYQAKLNRQDMRAFSMAQFTDYDARVKTATAGRGVHP